MSTRRLLPGEEIGGYSVVARIGHGGSSTVYKVLDAEGNTAALKLVHARDEVTLERLRREVATLQALHHPAVPQVRDVELDSAETFVVFDFVPGVPLSTYIARSGPMHGAELNRLADQLADALTAAHNSGVVHRDVTPANVMVAEESIGLIDFGLAHQIDDARLTKEGLVSGTAGYVAPEIIDGDEPDQVADEFAFAAVIAFAATGRPPFGTGASAIRRTIEAVPDVEDVAIAPILRTALHRDRGQRLTMTELAAALHGDVSALNRTAELELIQRTEVLSTDGIAPTTAFASGTNAVPDSGTFMLTANGDFDGSSELELRQRRDELRQAHRDLMSQHRPRFVWWAVAAGAIVAVAAAPIAPVITAIGLHLLAGAARAIERRAGAIAEASLRRGARRFDGVVHTLSFPWYLVRCLVEILPVVFLAVLLGGGVGLGAWQLVSAGGIVDSSLDSQRVGHAIALSLGMLVGWLCLHIGPYNAETRHGAARVAHQLAPTGSAARITFGVSLVAVALVGLLVMQGYDPLWWPLPDMPQPIDPADEPSVLLTPTPSGSPLPVP